LIPFCHPEVRRIFSIRKKAAMQIAEDVSCLNMTKISE
jgi:hypothetical protein